ncbi:hypothetical protein C8F04DRAFT_1404354 [Mycena alexandri]|uniref:Uncharacterized protein n=1 Tax=Mycena alexandri TaxID=1745969 RepID=A0AAD6WM44_9AGAR|nr:hypothetical protein C8F04DRAFT_1404354 [Mycena alexandri]
MGASAFCIAHLIAAMGDYILAHIAPPSSAPRGTPLHRSPAPSRRAHPPRISRTSVMHFHLLPLRGASPACKATTHAAEGPQIRAKPGSTLTITGGSAHPRRACERTRVPDVRMSPRFRGIRPCRRTSPTHTSRPPVMRAAVLIHCRSAPTHTTAHTKPSLRCVENLTWEPRVLIVLTPSPILSTLPVAPTPTDGDDSFFFAAELTHTPSITHTRSSTESVAAFLNPRLSSSLDHTRTPPHHTLLLLNNKTLISCKTWCSTSYPEQNKDSDHSIVCSLGFQDFRGSRKWATTQNTPEHVCPEVYPYNPG